MFFPEVSCGAKHTLVVTVEGDLFAWGDNRYGQCGLRWPSRPSSSPGGGGGDGGSGDGRGETGLKTFGGDKAKKKKKSFFSEKLGTPAEAGGKENGDGGGMVVQQPTQARKMTIIGLRSFVALRVAAALPDLRLPSRSNFPVFSTPPLVAGLPAARRRWSPCPSHSGTRGGARGAAVCRAAAWLGNERIVAVDLCTPRELVIDWEV